MWMAQSASSLMEKHLKTLQDAPSLSGTLTVQPIGGAPTAWKIQLSKPNLLKIESPDGFTLLDGKTIYRYTKKDNAWTETPQTEDSAAKTSAGLETMAWQAFFDKEAFKYVQTSKVGANRNVKGAAVTELVLTLEKGTLTLLFDPKMGAARGFGYKTSDADMLVTSADLEIGKEPIPAEKFMFTAPTGAKKQEAAAADAVTFAQVQTIFRRSCMPCHGPQQRAGGHDFSTYQGVLGAIVPGNSASSPLVRSISGPTPKMPQFRPPLPKNDVATITKWVDDGAKQ